MILSDSMSGPGVTLRVIRFRLRVIRSKGDGRTSKREDGPSPTAATEKGETSGNNPEKDGTDQIQETDGISRGTSFEDEKRRHRQDEQEQTSREQRDELGLKQTDRPERALGERLAHWQVPFRDDPRPSVSTGSDHRLIRATPSPPTVMRYRRCIVASLEPPHQNGSGPAGRD